MEVALNDVLGKLETIAVKYKIGSVESFRKLPAKKHLPQYYEIIKTPIDIDTIEKRIKKNQYKSTIEIFNDLELMTKNATVYNDPSSLLFESADRFYKYLTKNRKRLVAHMQMLTTEKQSEPLTVPPSISYSTRKRKSNTSAIEESKKQLYSLLDSVSTNTCSILSSDDVKSNDTTLSAIRRKIDEGNINNVDELVSELNSFCDDTLKKHKSSTETHKNMKQLKNYVKSLHSSSGQINININDTLSNQYSSSILTSLTPKERTSRKSTNSLLNKSKAKGRKDELTLMFEDFQQLSSNPRKLHYKLHSAYKALRDLKTEHDFPTCYDFLFCPPALNNPGYYEIIKQPIDMSTIYQRLKRFKYTKVEQFLGDFKLLIKNIKILTVKDSPMQKNAITIQNKLLEEFNLRSLKRIPEGCDKYKEIDPFETSIFVDSDERLDVALSENEAFKSLLLYLPTITDCAGKNLITSLHLNKTLTDISAKKDSTTVYEAFTEINLFLVNYCSKHTSETTFYEDAVLFHYELYRFIKPYLKSKSVKIDALSKLREIIQSIWDSILEHQNGHDHIYHYSLKCYKLEKSIQNNDNVINRTITFDYIHFCVVHNLYTNFETFQNDFVDLCFHVKATANSYSEPHRDVIVLFLHFLSVRDKLIVDIDTDAHHFSTAVLNSRLETDPYSFPAEQRVNMVDKYLVVDKDKLILCRNYAEYELMDFLDEHYDNLCIGADEIYIRGHCVRIGKSEKKWLLLGFIKNVEEDKFCVVAQLKNHQDVPRKYTRTYFPNELIVTDNLMIYPILKISGKFKNVFYTHFYQADKCSVEEALVFDHFYSYQMAEYFAIHQFFAHPPPTPPPPTSASSISLATTNSEVPTEEIVKSGTKRTIVPVELSLEFLSKNRTVTLESSTPIKRTSEKFEVATVKTSLTINNTRSIEDIITATPITGDPNSGLTHYLQICHNDSFYRRDEYVYVYDKDDELTVGKITDIWKNKEGAFMFKTAILYFPDDIKHNPIHMFYPNEIFRSNVEVSQSIECIYSPCSVVHPNYYYFEYPIIFSPHDVHVCDSMYNPQTNHIRKNKPYHAVYHAHPHVIHDEHMSIFGEDGRHKRHKIPSPFLLKEVVKIKEKRYNSMQAVVNEESTLPSIKNTSTGVRKRRRSSINNSSNKKLQPLSESTPKPTSNRKTTNINLSGDNESKQFNLSNIYLNDLKEQQQQQVVMCKWRRCNIPFKSNDLLIDHILTGHRLATMRVVTSSTKGDDNSHPYYVCCWSNCNQKEALKFPYLHQLVEHIKDFHCVSSYNANTSNANISNVVDQSLNRNNMTQNNLRNINEATQLNLNNMTQVNNATSEAAQTLNVDNAGNSLTNMMNLINQQNQLTNHSQQNMNQFIHEVIHLKTLVGPFLTSVSDSIEELKSNVDSMNKQMLKLYTTIVQQSDEIKQLKESQQSHQCCYNDHLNLNNNDDLNLNESVQINLPYNNSNYVNGASNNNTTSVPIQNGQSPQPTPGSTHNSDQVSIRANLEFLESASADLLRYALQESANIKDSSDSSDQE